MRVSKEPDVHRFIVSYWTERGYGPSYREIANATQLKSLNAVKLHVQSLIVKGLLVREKKMARTIRPVRPQGVAT